MTRPKSYYTEPDRQARAPGSRRFVPTSGVCVRYCKSPSSITRWVKDPAVSFPKPIQVVEGGPNLYDERELDEFDRRRASQAPEFRARVSARRKAEFTAHELKPALTAAPTAGADAAAAVPAERHMPPHEPPVRRPS